MCQRNLVKVDINTEGTPFRPSTDSSLKDKPTIVYNPSALRLIRDQSNHDDHAIW